MPPAKNLSKEQINTVCQLPLSAAAKHLAVFAVSLAWELAAFPGKCVGRLLGAGKKTSNARAP